MVVPAGALAAGSVTVESGVVNPSKRDLPGKIYRVEAPSPELQREVILELPYKVEQIPDGLGEQNLLGLTYRQGTWLEVPAVIDRRRRRVVLTVRHLCHFTWIAKEGQLSLAGKQGLAYRLIATPAFGPQLDAWKAIQMDRESYDDLAGKLLGLIKMDPSGIRKEWSGEAVARVQIGAAEYRLVRTPYRNPTGRGRLLAVLDSRGNWTTDMEVLYKVLFVHEVRRYLGRIDVASHVARLRENSRVLRKMKAYHRAASQMDTGQEVMSKILADGTLGVGVATGLDGYVAPILNYMIRTLIHHEMARVVNQMDEVALLLEQVEPAKLNYRAASYLYSLMADLPTRAANIKDLSTDSFPGAGQNWAAYTAKRVFWSFFSAGVDRSVAGLGHAAGKKGLDQVKKRLLTELHHAGQGAKAAWALWSLMEAGAAISKPLARYIEACQLRNDSIGVLPVYAAAKLLAGGTAKKTPPPDQGVPDRAPDPVLDGAWTGSFDYCYHPPGYEQGEVKCNNDEDMACTISADKMTCRCSGHDCGLAASLEQVSRRCRFNKEKKLECSHREHGKVEVRWILTRPVASP